MDAVETVSSGGSTLAIIARSTINIPGVSFFTPGNFSQQLSYMQHPAGTVIRAHEHREVERALTKTLEIIFLRKGRLRTDFYDEARNYVESRVLGAGDAILLVAGGHGFHVLEPVEMFDVKQGPYAGEADKAMIPAISPERVRITGGRQ